MKPRIIISAFGLTYAALFLLNIESCKELFREGILICTNSLVPSLLPFMIASNMILVTMHDVPKQVKIPMIYTLGLVFGFPIAAKYASEMLQRKEISFSTYKKLICCAGVPSAGFTVGFCGKHFGYDKGVLLYAITVISALLCSILIPDDVKPMGSDNTETNAEASFLSAISESVKDGIHRMINVCGYVIFFYTLSGVLCQKIKNAYAAAVISGILEFSTGCTKAMQADTGISYVLCAGILSFSGISVLMQCASIEREYGVREINGVYIAFRCLQALLSAVTAYSVQRGYTFVIPLLIILCVICRSTPFLQRIHKNKLKKNSKSSIINH